MNKDLEKLLYDDYCGIIAALRRGDYQKKEVQLEKIMQFAKRMNKEIREGTVDPKEMLYVVAIVYDLLIFSDAGWTIDFATEIYETVCDSVDW